MIDLAALQQYLQQQGSPLKLSKDNDQLPEQFRTYLSTMPNDGVTLTPSEIALNGDVLTVAGASTDQWPVQGMTNVTLGLATITITFTNANSETTIEAETTGTLPMTSSVTAKAEGASMVKDDTAGWALGLGKDVTGLTPLELVALGALGTLPVDIPQAITDLLKSALTVDPSQFEIDFYPGTDFKAYYTFGVNAPGATWVLIENILSFNGIFLTAVLQKGAVSAILIADVKVGTSTSVEVGVGMNNTEHWYAFVRPPQGDSWPTLIELATWIGGSVLGNDTQAGFSGVGFSTSAFDLQLSSAQMGFDWKTRKLDYLKIESVLTVAGAPLDVNLSLPNLTIAGNLVRGDTVKVVNMLAACNLPTQAVPDSLTLSAVDFSAQLSKSVYSLGVTVENVWSAGPVDLQKITLQVDYAKPEGFTGLFGATVAFNTDTDPIVFLIQAEYEDAESGWTFSGAIAPDTVIKIGSLIQALAKQFGIESVPKPIESLELTKLSLSYQTGTGKFEFDCEGTFEVSDQPVEMSVNISVTKGSTGNLASAAAGYEAHFGGQLVVNDLQFDLVFDTKSEGANILIADYVNRDAKSNTLKALVTAINEGAGNSIPDNLNIDIREVKLIYYSEESRQWAFGLGLGIEIKLSDIPGIGSKLPSDLDIGIEDLQILYASKEFTEAQVKVLNPLMPDGVRPLPEAGVAQSISFGGDLKLGDKTIPISSGVPAAKTTALALAPAAQADDNDPVKWINVNRQFGIFQFDRVGAEYQNNILSFVLDASISLGPVVFSVIGLSVGSPLNAFEPVFDLAGLGLSMTFPGLTLGGAFLKYKQEYYGEAMLQAPSFGFKVLGGWSPSYVDQGVEHPSSFFVYANINIPLGGPPFFFVTGLAGGFGINRKLRLPTIQELPSYPLLPYNAPPEGKSPIETIKNILPVLTYIFAEAPGEYWLAAGVQFTSFEMINGFVLVTVAFGVNLEIALIGSASMTLPPGPAPVAYIEIVIMASYSTETGLLGVVGVLSPTSFIYAGFVKLGGGFAFYTWLSGDHKGDFVVTLGGYGPGFIKPDYYPTVPRLRMAFGLGPFQVLGQAYFALTPAMFMAGIQMSATWNSGPIKAWLDAGVDFLIAWAPFHYEAHAYIVIGCSVDLGLFTVRVQVGADLFVWGPEFGGRAEVDLDVAQFTISFGARPTPAVPLGWTSFADKFLPKPNEPKTGLLAAAKRTLADPEPNTNVTKATVTAGLQRTVGDIWVLDPNHFVLDFTSTLSANAATWNPVNPTPGFPVPNDPTQYTPDGKQAVNGLYLQAPPKEMDETHVWNPDLNIAAMKEKGIKSLLKVTLLRATDSGTDEPITEVRLMPLLLNAAAALLGAAPDEPSPTDPPFVPFTLAGFRITPPIVKPSEVNDVPLIQLLFQQGIGTGFTYQSDKVDPNYTVTSVPSKTELIIDIKGNHTAELKNENFFLTSLVDTWVEGQRDGILDDLVLNGFTTYPSSEVTLEDFAKNVALTEWPTVEMIGQ